MGRWLCPFIGLALLAAGSPAHAAQRSYLFRSERLCDDTGEFCLWGTMTYLANPRLLWLRARVAKAPGPGLLRIRLIGQNRLGYRRLAVLEVQVRGNYSEIINHKMIPDEPDAIAWALDRIEFVPDQRQVRSLGGWHSGILAGRGKGVGCLSMRAAIADKHNKNGAMFGNVYVNSA